MAGPGLASSSFSALWASGLKFLCLPLEGSAVLRAQAGVAFVIVLFCFAGPSFHFTSVMVSFRHTFESASSQHSMV